MEQLEVNGVKYALTSVGVGTPLVLLHGFAGSSANWNNHLIDFARHFRVCAIDLLGHGHTDAPEDANRYAMSSAAADLMALFDRLGFDAVHLLGYSMGGRLALYTAAHHRDRLHSLILESASPGLADDADRRARRDSDEALAAWIERAGVEAFTERWENLPLFTTQTDAMRAALRPVRLANRVHGLANSLRGMGTGVQPPVWDLLSGLSLPVLLLAGALDTKFVDIAHQMHNHLPDARLVVMPDAGHTLHLEQPEQFSQQVLDFLRDADRRRSA